MADITLTANWSAPANQHPALLGELLHRVAILRRRSRRDRHLALVGRAPRHYRWFDAMFASMSGR
jgi:hypothetical protein